MARTPKKTRDWEEKAKAIMQHNWKGDPLLGAEVQVLAVAARPKRLMRHADPLGRMWRIAKPDADNVLKAVCDALEKAGVVFNDSCCVDCRVASLYAAQDEGPCVEIFVQPIGHREPMTLGVPLSCSCALDEVTA